MNYLEASARRAIRSVMREIRILTGREPRTYKSREAAIQATVNALFSDYSPLVSNMHEDDGNFNVRQNENRNR